MHCGLKISEVNCGLGCLKYVLSLQGITVFCFLGKTVHLQCITLPTCTFNGYCQINAWSGEGDGRINPAMHYAIPSGDVLSLILGPVVINLLYST